MKYKIKEYRLKKGISQAVLAEKAGVSRSIINALEKNDGYVTTTRTLSSIANALGVKVDKLFFND